MKQTLKFEVAPPNLEGVSILGQIPAGRILRSEPIFGDGKPYWLIEVDTDPGTITPTEIYRP